MSASKAQNTEQQPKLWVIKPTRHYKAHALVLSILFFSWTAWAQETRSLTGTLRLDTPTVNKNLTIELTVNNHSFVFAPIIGIIRPIVSSVSTQVELAAGELLVDYNLIGIIEDPVDYSIGLRCISCAETVPRQFFSPDGNALGLINSAFIDPEDLPLELNIDLFSRAFIKGKVRLLEPSQRDLRFTVSIRNSSNQNIVLATKANIKLPATQSSFSYQIDGLSRAVGGYQATLTCENCFGASRETLIFANPLLPTLNHSEINFTLRDEGKPALLSPLHLLLEDD